MMKSTLMMLACLAMPSLAAEVRVAGDESSGIFTKIIEEPPSSLVAFGANLQYHADNQENVPQYYDAQGRSRSRNYRRQPNPLQINHHEITTGQVNYQKNYQTKRVFSIPNRLQSVGAPNQNFISNFNHPTSQFSGQQQSVTYDRNGNPIRAFTRPVQSAFSNQAFSQPNRHANGRLQPQLSENFQAFQSGLQQSGNLFGNRPINSQGVFPNSQVGPTFQQVQTPNSNVNSFQQGAFTSLSTNRRQGNRFAGRPSSGLSSSQFNSRPITSVGSQFNGRPITSVGSQFNSRPITSVGSQFNSRPITSVDSQFNNRPVQSSGSQFNNRPIQSAGSQFNNRPIQSAGSQLNNRPIQSGDSQFNSRPIQTGDSRFNSRPIQSVGSQFNNRPIQSGGSIQPVGSQFNSRPIQSVGSQFNNRPIQSGGPIQPVGSQFNSRLSQSVGTQNNVWDRKQLSGLNDGQRNRQGFPPTGLLSNSLNSLNEGNRGTLLNRQFMSPQYPDFVGTGNAGRWQQGIQNNLDTGRLQQGAQSNLNTGRAPNQYALSNQNFGNVPGGISHQQTKSNLGYPVAGNSLT